MLIAICDDEALHREHTAALVQKELRDLTPEIDSFDSGEALLRSMSKGDYKPDIAVLDIQMGGMDGISLAKELNKLAPSCRIIFLTSFLNFATEVYSAEHIYFIVKDEVKKRMGEALRKAAAALPTGAARPDAIFASGKDRIDIIVLDDILFLERAARKTRIMTVKGEQVVSAPPPLLLKNVKEGYFIRCHQSFWVNAAKIASLKQGEFILEDNSRVPIGRSFRQTAKEQFFKSLAGE